MVRTQRKRTLEGVAAFALLVSIVAACGGRSIRQQGDDEATAGEGDDPPPTARGGASYGGRGGAGAVGPSGGTGTSGTFTGGDGGTISVGGTGTGAVGGASGAGACSATARIDPRVISWGADGIVSNVPLGVHGPWYTFDDCNDASTVNLPCTTRDPTLIGPDGATGWSVDSGIVCVRGIAPRVDLGPDGLPAYGFQWGFGVGFSLADGAGYDAASQCLRGLSFDITGIAPGTVRMNVATPTTIGVAHFVETALGVGVVLDFAAAAQGPWVPDPVPLDTTRITDIQFHVYTNTSTPQPFDFCVSNVRVIR